MSKRVDSSSCSDESRRNSEDDVETEELNEYEKLRASNIAELRARMQPVLQAYEELQTSVEGSKKDRKRKKHEKGEIGRRRSSRIRSDSGGQDVHKYSSEEDVDSPGRRRERSQTASDFSPHEGSETGSSSAPEEGDRETRHVSNVKGKEKIQRETGPHTPASSSRRRGTQNEGGKNRTQSVPSYFPGVPCAPNVLPGIPPGWKVVPDPENQSMPSYINMPPSGQHTSIPGQWQFLPSQFVAAGSSGAQLHPNSVDDLSISRESTVKEESLRRRMRRENKRNAEDETRRRQSAGLKPYAVQVKPSGFIDSGCRGHLKWQEHIRNLTPRMLDMSITTYDNQPEGSRKKLRDALTNKFEFLENEVTDSTLDKMIKTWMRKYRERMKRNFGGTTKAPTNLEVKQWDALQRHWSDPKTQEKSERMSENRKKGVYNPRVGRHGYAGKEAKMKGERETSPALTKVAAELKDSSENPNSAEMEKKNSSRLTIVEKNVTETNRRLQDMQNMLATFLSSLSGPTPVRANPASTSTDNVQSVGGEHHTREETPNHEKQEGVAGSTEDWWKKLEKSSDDEEDDSNRYELRMKSRTNTQSQDLNSSKLKKKEKAVTRQEVAIGDKVWMAHVDHHEMEVGKGTVICLGGQGAFHNRPIPPEYVRINLEGVTVNVPLLVPVSEAEQENLADAAGSSVLWLKQLTYLCK